MRLALVLLAAALLAGATAVTPTLACSDPLPPPRLAQSADVQPLPAVIARVEREVPGRVVDVQLDQKQSPWRYRFKVVTDKGNVVSVIANAETGQILSIKGKR